jgi:hypothetical protein
MGGSGVRAPGILNVGNGSLPNCCSLYFRVKNFSYPFKQEASTGRSEKNLLPLLGIELWFLDGTAHHHVTILVLSTHCVSGI